jgi:hypothetical protein
MKTLDLVFGFFVLLLGLGGLLRAWAIQAGYLKSVLIRLFERYGDAFGLYNPLFQITFWFGVLLAGVLMIAATRLELSFEVHVPMALAFIAAYYAFSNARFFREHVPVLMPYPRWYHDLLERTSTPERRRIAYMWLRLPRRTRRLMSSHDGMFATWADLVIMATSEGDNP